MTFSWTLYVVCAVVCIIVLLISSLSDRDARTSMYSTIEFLTERNKQLAKRIDDWESIAYKALSEVERLRAKYEPAELSKNVTAVPCTLPNNSPTIQTQSTPESPACTQPEQPKD
jgi:hypothetical protein